MSFDTLAPFYRWMERLFAREKMQRCRTMFLPEIPVPRKILLPGEGHGRFLSVCRERFPGAEIMCIDGSAKMLDQARRELRATGFSDRNVTFVQSGIFEWAAASESFDLLVTNYFLDCFREEELRLLIPKLAGCATRDASWLIADFQIPGRGLRRLRSRLIVSGLYVFFRMATRIPATKLEPPAPFLERAGFALHRRVESDHGLLRSDWWRRI